MQKLRMLPLFLLLVLISCSGDQSEQATEETTAEPTDTAIAIKETPLEKPSISVEAVFEDEIELPSDFRKLADARGDLTKDGIEERVLVVETIPPDDASDDYLEERYVRIYEQRDGQWVLKQQIFGGVLDKESGGMLGDPFEGVMIERGCLVFTHFGGSRIRWNYIHRYRWQNEKWELIGATIKYGASCDYWHEFDYNLMTGNVEGKEERENCDTDTSSDRTFNFKHRISPLPNLTEHAPGTVAVAVPDTDIEFYF